MSADNRSADQQSADDAARKARNPNASKQTIGESQADPEFQNNCERLKAARLVREAETARKAKNDK